MRFRRRSGFTLIELLVVIAIISVSAVNSVTGALINGTVTTTRLTTFLCPDE